MSKAIDRATAFKNEVSGQGTYKIVCKASNHDLAGPKKKHVDSECLCSFLMLTVAYFTLQTFAHLTI